MIVGLNIEYDRTLGEDVVDTSNPGRIISGEFTCGCRSYGEWSSQISTAGDITGTVGHYEQSNPKGNEYITEEGTATSYSRHHHKKGWDTTNIREAEYKNTKVNPKDVPVAVYGGHVENSKSDATVDASLIK